MNVVFCDKGKIPIKSCISHSHNYWEIILHLTGSNISLIDNTEYKISKGDVMVIPPNILHSGCSSALYTDMYVQAKNLDFSGIIVVHDYDGSIHTLMKLLHKITAEKESNYMAISDDILDTICEFIKKHSEKKYKYEFVNSLKNEIYKNIDNPYFGISDYVKSLGYNVSYVRRCFKEDLKKTPLEYLTELRINRAKNLLLQETFSSIEDVSKKCGYNDSFYFSKVFKAHVGMPPKDYKKRPIL